MTDPTTPPEFNPWAVVTETRKLLAREGVKSSFSLADKLPGGDELAGAETLLLGLGVQPVEPDLDDTGGGTASAALVARVHAAANRLAEAETARASAQSDRDAGLTRLHREHGWSWSELSREFGLTGTGVRFAINRAESGGGGL